MGSAGLRNAVDNCEDVAHGAGLAQHPCQCRAGTGEAVAPPVSALGAQTAEGSAATPCPCEPSRTSTTAGLDGRIRQRLIWGVFFSAQVRCQFEPSDPSVSVSVEFLASYVRLRRQNLEGKAATVCRSKEGIFSEGLQTCSRPGALAWSQLVFLFLHSAVFLL